MAEQHAKFGERAAASREKSGSLDKFAGGYMYTYMYTIFGAPCLALHVQLFPRFAADK